GCGGGAAGGRRWSRLLLPGVGGPGVPVGVEPVADLLVGRGPGFGFGFGGCGVGAVGDAAPHPGGEDAGPVAEGGGEEGGPGGDEGEADDGAPDDRFDGVDRFVNHGRLPRAGRVMRAKATAARPTVRAKTARNTAAVMTPLR